MCVYLRTKFQVSSIVLTSFKWGRDGGDNFTPPPPPTHTLTHTHTSKQTPKKPTQIRVKWLWPMTNSVQEKQWHNQVSLVLQIASELYLYVELRFD